MQSTITTADMAHQYEPQSPELLQLCRNRTPEHLSAERVEANRALLAEWLQSSDEEDYDSDMDGYFSDWSDTEEEDFVELPSGLVRPEIDDHEESDEEEDLAVGSFRWE